MTDLPVPPTPAPVILWHDPDDAAAGAAADALAACLASEQVAVERPATLASAAQVLQADPAARLLLVGRDTLSALCAALDAGTPPEAALMGWMQQAGMLRDLMRRARRRARMVPPDQLSAAPRDTLVWLGVTAQPALPAAANAAAVSDPLLRMIARAALREHPGALALAQEIEAGVPGLDPGLSLMSAEPSGRVFAQLRSRLDDSAAALDSARQRAEADARARTQAESRIIEVVQAQTEAEASANAARAEAEAAIAARAEAEARAIEAFEAAAVARARAEEEGAARAAAETRLEAEIRARIEHEAQLAGERDAARNALEDSRIENEALQARLEAQDTKIALLSTQIEMQVRDLAGENERAEAAQAQLAKLRRELANLQSARAREVARLTEAEKARAQEVTQLTEAHRDTERRLEQQLHQLREGLKSHEAELETAMAARHDLARQLESMHDLHVELAPYFQQATDLEGHAETLRERIDELGADVAAREAELARSQAALERIRNSLGYRLTAPLRVLSGLFRQKAERDV